MDFEFIVHRYSRVQNKHSHGILYLKKRTGVKKLIIGNLENRTFILHRVVLVTLKSLIDVGS